MRKLFTLCLLVFTLSASAQWQQTGSKVRYVNGLGIPSRDTAAGVLADSSQILIRPADSSLYVKYKRTWLRVGGSGFSGSGTTNYIPKFTSSTAIGNSQIFDNGTGVGIGTTSPGAALDVRVNSGILVGANSRSFIRQTVGGDAEMGCASGGYLSIFSDGSEKMRILSSGNVGIGTASPTVKLDVNGGIQAVGLLIGNDRLYLPGNRPISDWISASLAAGYSSTNSYGWINGANNLIFGTDGVERMRITSGGNTLIGTTTDNGTDRLQVSGSMNVSTLATTNNLSVTTNATVGGTLRVTGTTTLGTLNAGAINGSSIDVGTGNGTFGNLYSGGIVQMLGVNVKYRNISATYTATTADDYFINITSGTFTLNLPTAATPYGQVYVIKNSGTGTVTVDPNGTQTIDGATTFTMNVQNQSITIIGDGSNWKIVSKYL